MCVCDISEVLELLHAHQGSAMLIPHALSVQEASMLHTALKAQTQSLTVTLSTHESVCTCEVYGIV